MHNHRRLFYCLLGFAAFFLVFPAISYAATLDSLSVGSTILINGQGGANYKFIKLKPMDDDGNVMTHSDGVSGSYWMLADNYCGLAGRPSNCVTNTAGATSATGQLWNPTSDGTRYNNWRTMADTQYGIYRQVLTPFYNDLPPNIGGTTKDQAILTKAYPMSSITAVGGNIGTAYKSTCYLTAGSVGTGTANTSNCTWSDKISLPSYSDWQETHEDGLSGYGIYYTAGNASAYMATRFGAAWNSSASTNGLNWYPWLRSPDASDVDHVWYVRGNNSAYSVSNSYAGYYYGVSPVLWLSSDLAATCGDGTYVTPYRISQGDCQPAPAVRLSPPTATWSSGSSTLSVTGLANHKATGQSVLLWAAACNTNGQCQQKTVTITSNGADQAYSLIWSQNELSAGTYTGTIWVGAHVIANPSDQDNDFIQSNAINFTINPRLLDLTVVKNRAFDVTLGDASIFNLAPGTDQGVTTSIDPTSNLVSVSGTLTQDTQATFGSIVLNFEALDVPQSVFVNTSLN